MKSAKLLIFMFAVAGLAACSSDDNELVSGGQEPVHTLRPLTIEVSENPMVNPEAPSNSPEGGEKARATRAAITTTTSLSKFYLDYVYGSQHSTNGESITASKNVQGKWSTDCYWPDTDSEVKWYAHSHGTFIANGGTPYINFTVEEAAANQKDLLVATTSGTWGATNGHLSFTFDHACSALRFYMKKAKNISDYTLTVTEVKLCNVINTGDYYYGTQSWTPGNSRSSYTLYSGTAKTLGTSDYVALDASDAPYLFMIPQTLTAWNGTTAINEAIVQTYIQLTCTIEKDAIKVYDGTAYIPFAGTFEQGNQHDVKINIGKNSLYNSNYTKIIN